ncbi:phage protease [Pseudomonas aeruginosa]|uniref:phage protease n=1 Tax=Pseudomonas aeruginosa TaxID=287 RepID=UPI0039E9AAA9
MANLHLLAPLRLDSPAALAGAFRVVPLGEFQANDGRPGVGQRWQLNEVRGQAIVQALLNRGDALVIDYEHKTLQAGEVNPAAGWIKRMEMRVDGLYAVDVQWTDQARQMIRGGHYRYISPALTYDAASLEVTGLHSVALTNNPALNGLTDLSLVALSALPPEQGDKFAGLSLESRAYLERMIGVPLEQAAAELYILRYVPLAPEGISDADWQKLYHQFGTTLLA